MKTKYGITLDEYDQMLKDQKYRCAICDEKSKLCIDHCHATGSVRGLLCLKCNSAIGYFGDNLQKVKAAAEYLEHFSVIDGSAERSFQSIPCGKIDPADREVGLGPEAASF